MAGRGEILGKSGMVRAVGSIAAAHYSRARPACTFRRLKTADSSAPLVAQRTPNHAMANAIAQISAWRGLPKLYHAISITAASIAAMKVNAMMWTIAAVIESQTQQSRTAKAEHAFDGRHNSMSNGSLHCSRRLQKAIVYNECHAPFPVIRAILEFISERFQCFAPAAVNRFLASSSSNCGSGPLPNRSGSGFLLTSRSAVPCSAR